MTETVELRGRPVVSGLGRGKALVSQKPISFLGGVDPESGEIVEKDHDLNGKSVKNAILCFPHGHGSTVGSYVLYSLAAKSMGPRAIVNKAADPVVVVGAVISETPMVDKVDIRQIRTGDILEVDGEKGTVKILKREEPCT
jgi:predicted aconitase with swiveling domain